MKCKYSALSWLAGGILQHSKMPRLDLQDSEDEHEAALESGPEVLHWFPKLSNLE